MIDGMRRAGLAGAARVKAPAERAAAVTDKVQLVARNVHRMRQERGYSQGELARRAGLSKQTLSGIEAGEANPTVLTLSAIATGLGVPVAHLLTEYGSPLLVRRAADASWRETPDGESRELDQIYGFGYVRTAVIRYARTGGQPPVRQPHRPGTLHHLYVLSGRARIGPVGEQVELGRGDFIRFPGDLPHLVSVVTQEAVVHMLTTVPHVSQLGGRDG
jgi:transcriptional regulator with XRE-family HTH domain